jgi:hypothetical protein
MLIFRSGSVESEGLCQRTSGADKCQTAVEGDAPYGKVPHLATESKERVGTAPSVSETFYRAFRSAALWEWYNCSV